MYRLAPVEPVPAALFWPVSFILFLSFWPFLGFLARLSGRDGFVPVFRLSALPTASGGLVFFSVLSGFFRVPGFRPVSFLACFGSRARWGRGFFLVPGWPFVLRGPCLCFVSCSLVVVLWRRSALPGVISGGAFGRAPGGFLWLFRLG